MNGELRLVGAERLSSSCKSVWETARRVLGVISRRRNED